MEPGNGEIVGIAQTLEEARREPLEYMEINRQTLRNIYGKLFFAVRTVKPGPVIFKLSIDGEQVPILDHKTIIGTDLHENPGEGQYSGYAFSMPINYIEEGEHELKFEVGYMFEGVPVWVGPSEEFGIYITEADE